MTLKLKSGITKKTTTTQEDAMQLNKVIELRNNYDNLIKKARNAKTKKTAEKYRDLARPVRSEFADLIAELDFSSIDLSQFNIMAPVGGPYATHNCSDFKIETNMGSALQVSFLHKGTRYAGYIHLLEKKCGVDNFEILKNLALVPEEC